MNDRNKADVLILGGIIYCKENMNHKYIAIKKNKIIALGDQVQENLIGPETKIIHLKREHFVVPGLHDNHIHLIQAGMLDKYIDLSEAASQEDAARKVAGFAETIPEETWVIGFRWSRSGWKDKSAPTKASLDAVIPNRPVLLFDSELHCAWVNSRALEICGLNDGKANMDFGDITRDSHGKPSGLLYERALCLVGKYAFDFSEQVVENLIYRYMDHAVKWGITSVSDMTPYLDLDLAYEEIYYRMDRRGQLKLRVNAARNLFEDIDKVLSIQKRAESSKTGMYRVPYMKQFLDGGIANYTALLTEPYSDNPEKSGTVLLDLKKLGEAVEKAHMNNISVRLHACGDGAVHKALDVYEKAIKKYGNTNVHHQVEHIESILPSDIGRFGRLGVIASVQPEHIVSGIPTFEDNCIPKRLGKDRTKYTWPFRSLLREGAILAGGSDAPVVEGNPFYGIYCGMERTHADGSPTGGWNSQEKIGVQELLDAYTLGAAIAEGREDELGTIEVGKLADIAILDRNILKTGAEQIKKTQVLYTIVDGKIVYQKDRV